MATEKLNISGWDAGWPTGFVTNVDESIANADGQTVSTQGVSDVVVFDLSASALLNSDNITNVDITLRASVVDFFGGTGSLSVELLIGGVSKGSSSTPLLSSILTNHILTNPGWDQDWTAAELEDMQVRVTTVGDVTAWIIDCLDVDITFTPSVSIISPERAVVLSGKVPIVDETTDLAQERPLVGTVILAGQAPVLADAIPTAVRAAALLGKVSYLNSLTVQLQPNAWDDGWPFGFITNIDEPIAQADNQTVHTTSRNDVVVFDLDNTSLIDDLDTVLSVTITVRGRTDNITDPLISFDVDLLINGVSRGTGLPQQALSTVFSNQLFSNETWNDDWTAAEINSAQVRVTARRIERDFSFWYIDAIDVVVEYVKQSPFLIESAATPLNLSGQAPAITVNVQRSTLVRVLTLSTDAATLQLQEQTLPSEAVSQLAPKTVGALVNYNNQPSAKFLALLGQSLTLHEILEFTVAGTATLASDTFTLDQTKNHLTTPAVYRASLFPEAPVRKHGPDTIVGPGRLVGAVVGKAPEAPVQQHVVVNPVVGSISLVEQQLVYSFGSSAVVADASILLFSNAPTLGRGAPIFTANTGLNFTGHIPSPTRQFARLVMTTYVPVPLVNFRIIPAAATINVLGTDVVVENASIALLVGILNLTGYVPTMAFSSFLTPGTPEIVNLTVDRNIEIIATPTDIISN